MIAAARETMKALKIEGHEALFVAHSDEEHPHIHIIVNRVSPENGIAAPLGNDWVKLSNWAKAYEKRRGKIYCPQRVANEEERREKGNSSSTAANSRPTPRGASSRGPARSSSAGPRSTAMFPQYHREQRKALYDEKERRIAHRQRVIREKNRPAWAFVYRQQKQERKELDETRTSRFKGLLYFLRHRQELKSPGGLVWLFQGLAGYHGVDFFEEMNKRHEADRKRLSARVGQETREAIAEENELYRTELETLRHGQAAERQTLRDEYAAQSPARPRARRKSRRAAGEERAEKPMREEFKESVRKRVRQRKRDEKKRGKGQGRERED